MIYSRFTSKEDVVSHTPVSSGVKPDQWFTLIYGADKHAGEYAIKGQQSGRVLYSRKEGGTKVGNDETEAKYDEDWFTIEAGSGKYVDSFRLITSTESRALYSRSSPDPTFSNMALGDPEEDEYFNFLWGDLTVDGVEFKVEDGKVVSLKTIALAEGVLTNIESSAQTMPFSVNSGVTDSSTFGYSDGFPITLGTVFNSGIPSVGSDGLYIMASTNAWTWAETTEYNTKYASTVDISVDPGKSVGVSWVVNQAILDVPYIMHLSSGGVKVETEGIWRGVTSWDLRYTTVELD